MIRLTLLLITVVFFLKNGQAQPYLFIETNKLNQLQLVVQEKESHHEQAFSSLLNRINANNLLVYGGDGNRYERSYLAQEAAFASLISTKRIDQEKYAKKAWQTIREIYENPDQKMLPHQDYGLSRAMMQLGLALPYAWCRQFWTDQERDYVETKINEALDAWIDYNHANFGNERGSNWVAVCRGGELTLMLAANQQKKRKDRYAFLIEQLLMHMENGYGSLGVSQEGMGYIEYGVSFLLKATYAASSSGDSTLFRQAQNHEWWRLAMYAESFQPFSRKFLMTGVSGSGAFNEGFASLLLHQVPASQLPYYTWWYDMHMGVKAPYPPAEKFDNHRAGTIWSVLYYPLNHTSLDPTGIFPVAAVDDHGYYFFRNRWQDENDIILSLMADSHHHGNAWDQPEIFSLNIMGYNNRFFGGPGKKRENKYYSTLLVNDKYNIEHSVRLNGKTVSWQADENGGNLIVSGHELYQAMAVDFAQRHMTLKFLPDNQMVMVMLDTVRSDQINKYTWQANLGDNESDDSLQVQPLKITNDNIHLKISGRNKAYLSGWFRAHDLKLENSGDPLQISINAQNAGIISIFWLGEGDPPHLDILNEGKVSKYKIKDQEIIYRPTQNKITIN